MDDRYLEYFLRVIELGSINKAALELNLSQPALSRHIAALEHEFGTPLFSRNRGGVRPTDAGKLLAERTRPVLRQLAILKEQIGEHAASQIAAGFPIAWQQILTVDFTARFIAQNPDSKLRLYEVVSQFLREYMLSGLLDLVILPSNAPAAEGYRKTPLATEPMVLVATRSKGLNPKKPVSISDLKDRRYIITSRPNMMRQEIENALQKQRIKIDSVMETNTVAMSLELVSRGIGDGIMPSSAIFNYDPRYPISWAPIRGLSMSWLLWENEARLHSPAVQAAKRLLIALIKEKLASGQWEGATAYKPKDSGFYSKTPETI